MSTGEVDVLDTSTPGESLKALRIQRGLSRPEFAVRADISVSYLEKVERGDRPLTPGVAASAAAALGVTTDALMGGSADVEEGLKQSLEEALRDYDLATVEPPEEPELGAMMARAYALRDAVEVRRLLRHLPGVLRSATARAVDVNSPESWATLTDAYGLTYWLAARHRWRLVADLAVARQEWAAREAGPLSRAMATIHTYVLDARNDSFAVLSPDGHGWTVRQGGPVPLWDEVERALALWQAAGAPGPTGTSHSRCSALSTSAD